MWIEIFFFGNDFRKPWERVGGWETGKGRHLGKEAPAASTLSREQPELSPTEVLLEVVTVGHPIVISGERWAVCPVPPVMGPGPAPWGVNLLVYLHVGRAGSRSQRSLQEEGHAADPLTLDFWCPEPLKTLTPDVLGHPACGTLSQEAPRRPGRPTLPCALWRPAFPTLSPTAIHPNAPWISAPLSSFFNNFLRVTKSPHFLPRGDGICKMQRLRKQNDVLKSQRGQGPVP